MILTHIIVASALHNHKKSSLTAQDIRDGCDYGDASPGGKLNSFPVHNQQTMFSCI